MEKTSISENFTMSMAEIASLSKGLSTTSKIFESAPQGKKQILEYTQHKTYRTL